MLIEDIIKSTYIVLCACPYCSSYPLIARKKVKYLVIFLASSME